MIIRLLLAFALIFLPVQASWYGADWQKRIKIEIDSTNIDEDLTEFPVYVDLADLPASFFDDVLANGADLRVTAEDAKTELAREIVELDQTANTGELWFKADLISSSEDTDFYIYYSNPAAVDYFRSSLYGSENVWSNGFVAVYHMNQDPSASNIIDSTSVRNDLVANGSFVPADLVLGNIGNAIEFDGVNQALQSSLTVNLDTFTMSAHLNFNDHSQQNFINNISNKTFYYGSSRLRLYQGGGHPIEGLGALALASWNFASVTYNGTESAIYRDDNQENTSATPITSTVSGFEIGHTNPLYPYSPNGMVDEIHLVDKARSAAWLRAEYENQFNPASFYTVAANPVQQFDSGAWNGKELITIRADQVNGNLNNFPVYVDLSHLPQEFFLRVKSDGSDIRMTENNQYAQLPVELVSIDTVNGEGELWFNAPVLSSTYDNDFYLWYGNGSAAFHANNGDYAAERVWAKHYKGVYHMSEDPSALFLKDSTENNHDGVINGAMLSSDLVPGQLGSSFNFDGVNDFVKLAPSSFYTGDNLQTLTMSAWFKTTQTSNGYLFSVKRMNTDSTLSSLSINQQDGTTNFPGYAGFLTRDNADTQHSWLVDNSSSYNNDEWHKLVASVNGTTRDIYVDGNRVGSDVGIGMQSVNGNTELATIATFHIAATSPLIVNGSIDFVTFSRKAMNEDWASAEYLNQSKADHFYKVNGYGPNYLNPYQWKFMDSITVNATEVNGDQTDFPVYVDLSDMTTRFFSAVQADGADIRLTQGDGLTEIPFELVEIDTVNGAGELWFQAPFLAGNADTQFYIHYGNDSAEAYADDHEFGAQAVWSNGYLGVYHLNEDPSLGPATIKNSASDLHQGTAQGAMLSTDLVNGAMGRALNFDGTNDEIIGLFNQDLLTELNFSAWFKSTGASDTWPRLVSISDLVGDSTNDSVLGYDNDGSMRAWTKCAAPATRSGEVDYSATLFVDDTWRLAHYSYNGATGDFYINDSLLQSAADNPCPDIEPAKRFVIGGYYINDTSAQYDGQIDEARISDKARSASWVDTEYNNQSLPSSFYSVQQGSGQNAIFHGRMF